MKSKKIAVVGAGITGLTAAWYLQNKGHEVVHFERRDYPGGSIKSAAGNGWITEYGPNTIQLKSRKVLKLIEDLDLTDRIVDANPNASKRFIVHDGRLVALPSGLKEAVLTPLFSGKGKLRLLKEPFVSKGNNPDETLASFVKRRLGPEILDYAIDPFVAGIYAGNPDELSVRCAFPKLYNLEQSYGSLLAGVLRNRWKKKKEEKFKTRLVSFPKGLSELPDRLSGRLNEIRYGSEVSRIQKTKVGWEVIAGSVKTSLFDIVILNIPLYRINEQLINGGGAVADVAGLVVYPPISVIQTGYARNQVEHPLDGFGFLVPANEKRKILGALFSSTLFPGRAPDGNVLITTFIGGSRQPELATLETEKIKQLVADEHRELLGINGEPRFFDHIFWPNSIPQYTPRYNEVLTAIRDLEEKNQGVYLAGNFRGGISLPDCIENGINLAEKFG